jgi:hypothetical protein
VSESNSTDPVVEGALKECRGELRAAVGPSLLPDDLLDSFILEFTADFTRVFAGRPDKWQAMGKGLLLRARAIGTLAQTYAYDDKSSVISSLHLHQALAVVKDTCIDQTAGRGSDEVIERYRLMYESCLQVPGAPRVPKAGG